MFFKLQIYDIPENAYGHIDFAAVAVNIYKIGTAMTQPLTRKNMRGEEDVQISDYMKFWTDTAKDDEQIY